MNIIIIIIEIYALKIKKDYNKPISFIISFNVFLKYIFIVYFDFISNKINSFLNIIYLNILS